MIIELVDEAMDVPFEILKGPSLNPNIPLWATVCESMESTQELI
jgi:hypothetical protein